MFDVHDMTVVYLSLVLISRASSAVAALNALLAYRAYRRAPLMQWVLAGVIAYYILQYCQGLFSPPRAFSMHLPPFWWLTVGMNTLLTIIFFHMARSGDRNR